MHLPGTVNELREYLTLNNRESERRRDKESEEPHFKSVLSTDSVRKVKNQMSPIRHTHTPAQTDIEGKTPVIPFPLTAQFLLPVQIKMILS